MRTTKKKAEKKEDGFTFEIGAKYENMKGAYEVVSIRNNSMVIRWDDGNEAVTQVDLQKRIIERLAYEAEVRRQKKIADKAKAPKRPKRK